jgi:ectoine hydroxylase-related dioxygenase (phytanoyl-CoA dioxygenase family)
MDGATEADNPNARKGRPLHMAWLTNDHLRQFASDGYLVLRDVVDESLLAAADAEIDVFLAETALDESDRAPGQHAWVPPRSRLPRCEDILRKSPALTIAQELVSPNAIDHAFDHIQVATTVPSWSHIPGGPHIDGHGPGQDPPHSFTMLVGVLLTDQREPQSGNLWVWPGSHLDHERLFHERGTKILQRTSGHVSLLDPPAVLQRPSLPIYGRRGDLVLAHFLLGHNKGGNTARHVRRTIYYRLAVPGHAQRWDETFLDAWTEYPRVRAILSAAPTE